MFLKLQHLNQTADGRQLFMLVDSCFTQHVVMDCGVDDEYDYLTTISEDHAAEFLTVYYKSINRNVARNLHLYYLWVAKQLCLGEPTSYDIKHLVTLHSDILDREVPHLKFSQKYKNSITQYFKNIGYNIQ